MGDDYPNHGADEGMIRAYREYQEQPWMVDIEQRDTGVFDGAIVKLRPERAVCSPSFYAVEVYVNGERETGDRSQEMSIESIEIEQGDFQKNVRAHLTTDDISVPFEIQ